MWDADQYLKYSGERSRPFFDLLARVETRDPRRIADLGCGPGNLTQALSERWPAALVVGVDHSPDMLAKAQPLAVPGRLEFALADLATWSAEAPLDLVVSNAALHWVGDHEALLGRLARLLTPAGTLAVQMPYHFQHAAHLAIEEVKSDPRWRDALEGVGLHQRSVMPVVWYVERLHDLGFTVDAWETTYIHVLTGEDPVLEWYKGSALRPLLNRLGPQASEAFLDELGRRLKAAYPARGGITLLPFPRIFFVASRR